MRSNVTTISTTLCAILAMPACAWADGDADPTTNQEIQGQWVPHPSSTPSQNPPQTISRVFRNGFGVIIQEEKSSGTASGARPVSLSMEGNTWSGNVYGNTVNNSGNASLTETTTWTWEPANAPIQNKDVTMAITGSASAEVAVSITGNDGADGATASASIDATGSGTVGGTEIINMVTQPKKTIEVNAFISQSEASTKYSLKGELKKVKGGGSVSGDAASQETQTYQGQPSQTKTMTISASITATGNTNNIKSYVWSLSQTVSGAISCANSAFDASSARLTGSSNFIMTSN